MKYKDYRASDFANDSFFIRWVKKPDNESTWFWESFIRENPSCRKEIEKAIQFVSLFHSEYDVPTDEEMARMRNALFMALHAEKEELKSNHSARRRSFQPSRNTWLKLAASLVLIPVAFLWIIHSPHGTDRLVPMSNEGSPSSAMETRSNPMGQKSVLFLDDGTKVWLNAASSISYGRNFNEHDTREVFLDGEAFFEVMHNPEKPFIVHASSIKIKVLGTSFNVKSYSEEETIETTLIQGKVCIEQSDTKGNRVSDLELRPNQCAVFDKDSKVMKIKEVVADNAIPWKQERLVFDEESMDNVVQRMERWYNVKIHVANRGKLDCRMTATIERETLEDVLNLIAASFDISYRVDGSNVYIDGTLCKTEQ